MELKLPEIKLIPVEKLKRDPSNPNYMNEEQMDGLRTSMKRWGYLDPVIIDQHHMIADGEHRLDIFMEFGRELIPCYIIRCKTDVERRLIRQTMNKLHGRHRSEYDVQELKILFDSDKLDELTVLIAGNKDQYLTLLEQNELIPRTLTEKPLTTGENPKYNIREGDLYLLGNHRVLCGDNQDAVMMELLQGNAKITQLNTDPPYGVDYVSKNKFLNEQAKGNRSQIEYANDEINNDLYAMFMNICKTINWADYNTFYIFSAGLHLQELRMAIDDCGLKWGDYLIWVKNNHVLGRKDYNAKHEFCIYGWHKHHKFHGPFRTTLLEYDKPHHSDLHPTIKPIELISQLITDGTKEGDIVLDVFGGSGTTLIASEKTNRVCYMMEISPYFTSVIIERWELETGKKAKKIKS